MIALPNNKRFVWGCWICALLLLIEGVCLFMIKSELAKQKKTLDRNQRHLAQLNNRTTFPSMENVRLLREKLSNLEAGVSDLENDLMRDPFPSDAVESADFLARAQDVIERFKNRAKHAGVALPETMEAGFAKYTRGGMVPDVELVPRLCRQLYSVERVADVLVRSGVDSIDRLTREEFETDEKPVPMEPRRRRPRSERSRLKVPHPAVDSDFAGQANGLYSMERINVTFTAKEDALWRVLDLIATAPHCMAVAEFSHSTQSTILSYNPETVKRGSGDEDETVRYLAEGILVGKTALSRPERIISGQESIKVWLVVEVYNIVPVDDTEDSR